MAAENADAGKTLTVIADYADPTVSATPDRVSSTVTVGDTGDPMFSSPTATVRVNENTPTPYVVGTYTATGGTGTITYIDNSVALDINPDTGVLTLTADIDYETESTHPAAVTITATDEDGDTGEMTLTVTVVNVDEPGAITFNPARLVVGTAVTATLADEDTTDLGTVQWTWSGGAGDVTGTGARRTYTPDADTPDPAGTILSVSARYLDTIGGLKTVRATIKVLVVGTNTAPVVRTSTGNTAISVLENRAISIGLSAVDPDDVDLVWSLSGADADSFTLARSRGKTNTLNSVSTPNYETAMSYGVTVNVSDGDVSALLSLTINVVNVEERGAISIIENADKTLTATLTDPDENLETIRWRWSGGGRATSTDASSVYTPVAADAGITIRVTATYTDGVGTSRDRLDETFGISPSDNNDPVLSGPNLARVREGGTTIFLTYKATDQDGDYLGTMGVEATDGAYFSSRFREGSLVSSATMVLTLTDPDGFDFERKPSYSANIVVSDGRGGSDSLNVVIRVINVDEPGYAEIQPATPGVGNELVVGVFDEDWGDGSGDFEIVVSWSGTGVPANWDNVVTEDSIGAILTATVSYNDVFGRKTLSVSTPPIAAERYMPDSPGSVTWTHPTPLRVGGTIDATLYDEDGPIEGTVSWQWHRNADSGDQTAISGATSNTYTAVAADQDKTLTVHVTYDDGHGTGKEAVATSVIVEAKPVVTTGGGGGGGTTTTTPTPPTTPPVPEVKTLAPVGRITALTSILRDNVAITPRRIDAKLYFTAIDGLTFTAATDNSAVATVNIQAGTLLVTPVNAGQATITVTAARPGTTETASQRVVFTVIDRRTPETVVTVDPDFPVYWTDFIVGKIQRVNDDGSVDDIVTKAQATGARQPHYIAFDLDGGKMYWTNRVSGAIGILRANLDGTGVEDLVSGLGVPSGIALDVENDTMYWADWGTRKIQRANLDGSNVRDVITARLTTPTGVAVDTENGKIYWADRGGRTKGIKRANLNGTRVQTLVTAGLRAPNGIALDVENGKMYWTDGGTDQIQRANLDGSEVETLVSRGLTTPNGIALDLDDGKMYWTDSGSDRIQRADLDGSDIENLVTEGLDTPTDIALLTDPTALVPVVVVTDDDDGAVPEDVNGDGKVDAADIALVLSQLGKKGKNAADVNGDGMVDINDLLQVAGKMQMPAAAPAAYAQALDALRGIDAAQLKGWLTEAKLSGLISADYQHGLLVLEQLLALLPPEKTALLANFPNPFNPETRIPYQLSADADVSLSIYDMRGQLVRTIDSGHQHAGVYANRGNAIHWDGRNMHGEQVASGVYIYCLTAGEYRASRRMVIMK